MSIIQSQITESTGTPMLPLPTCPLCHTVDLTITPERLAAGGAWACTLCSQNWNQSRLDVVAAYQRYDALRKADAPPA